MRATWKEFNKWRTVFHELSINDINLDEWCIYMWNVFIVTWNECFYIWCKFRSRFFLQSSNIGWAQQKFTISNFFRMMQKQNCYKCHFSARSYLVSSHWFRNTANITSCIVFPMAFSESISNYWLVKWYNEYWKRKSHVHT